MQPLIGKYPFIDQMNRQSYNHLGSKRLFRSPGQTINATKSSINQIPKSSVYSMCFKYLHGL